jgi:hypothetical protein
LVRNRKPRGKLTPGPEDDVSQAEKRRIIREQATMHGHAVAEAAMMETGRFAAVNATIVTGATPIPKYPAASPHQADPVGLEPPLGYDINEMPAFESSAVSSSFPVEETGGAPSSVPPEDVAAPPPSSKGSDDGRA